MPQICSSDSHSARSAQFVISTNWMHACVCACMHACGTRTLKWFPFLLFLCSEWIILQQAKFGILKHGLLLATFWCFIHPFANFTGLNVIKVSSFLGRRGNFWVWSFSFFPSATSNSTPFSSFHTLTQHKTNARKFLSSYLMSQLTCCTV